MSTSYINTEDLGRIKLFRRKGLKNIRISINSVGEVRLSVPWYVPKTAGLRYLKTKKDWIKRHQQKVNTNWSDGQLLIKGYMLRVHSYQRKIITSSLDGKTLNVYIPDSQQGEKKQRSITRYVNKFLKNEAKKTLIPLAAKMALRSGFQPKGIRIKYLKSRWGSCNKDKVITLNLALLKLPDKLIEYVIFHELAHTRHLNHSKLFWQEVEAILPGYKQLRNDLKIYNQAGIF